MQFFIQCSFQLMFYKQSQKKIKKWNLILLFKQQSKENNKCQHLKQKLLIASQQARCANIKKKSLKTPTLDYIGLPPCSSRKSRRGMYWRRARFVDSRSLVIEWRRGHVCFSFGGWKVRERPLITIIAREEMSVTVGYRVVRCLGIADPRC